LAKNPAYHSKTKHIDVQYRYDRRQKDVASKGGHFEASVSSEKFSCCRETMGVLGLEK